MRTPESKQLSRREMLLGILGLGLTTSCSATNATRLQAVEVVARPKSESPVQRWPEFEHLDSHVAQYQSPIQGIKDHLTQYNIQDIIDPDYLMSKCLEKAPAKYSEPVKIDFDGIPNGKLKSMEEFAPELSANPNVARMTLHEAPPENDTGIVCIWYGQIHGSRLLSTNELTRISPRGVNSQLRIVLSAQELVYMGVRLFGMEGDIESYPATPDDFDGAKDYLRVKKDLQYESSEIKKGMDAFRVLKSRYPFIDVYGIDSLRKEQASIKLGTRKMRKQLIEALDDLNSPERLLDQGKTAAYMKYLESHGEKGREILREIKLARTAQGCLATTALDHEGTDFIGPAIHMQLTHMKSTLKDPSFLKAQAGQEFAPNVFAIQYGLAHNGIPKACQKLGVSCIEVNATTLKYSYIQKVHQESEQGLSESRRILKNLKR